MSSSGKQTGNFELFNTSGIDIPVETESVSELFLHLSEDLGCKFEFVEIVFIDTSEIIKINKEFLQRDYITDIISFRYDEDESNQNIEGTLYCCAQRIKEQADEYNQPVQKEFHRVIAHGLIHLTGYNDQTAEEKAEMTYLENKYLQKLSFS